MITFGFGLVHGFAFSFCAARQLQFAGKSSADFAAGVQRGGRAGPVARACGARPAAGILFRYVVPERIGMIILSVLIGHTGWHWMTERAELLSKFPWPAFDASTAAAAMRWAIALLAIATAWWAVNTVLRKWGVRLE